MSNRLSRDTEDAAKVLAAFRDRFHPRETLAEKLSAAEDLRAKLVNVIGGVRQWSVKSLGDDTCFSLNSAGTVQLRTDQDSGLVQLSRDGVNWHSPALEYDVYHHEWIGRQFDPDLVSAPGEPKPKRAALVVLAEHLVQLLGEEAPRE